MEIKNLSAGLSVANEGLKRAEAAVAKAADDINTVNVAAQNKLAAATGRGEPAAAEVVADNADGAAVSAAREDLAGPVVDLLMAKVAYKASLEAVKVTGDVMRDAVDTLGNRKS